MNTRLFCQVFVCAVGLISPPLSSLAVSKPTTKGPKIQITTTSLPPGTVGFAYSQTLGATGGATPYTWSIASGSLPGGITLVSSGTLAGWPTAAGSSTLTVEVIDSIGRSASRTLTLGVAAPLSILTSTLPNGMTGAAYGATMRGAGGTTPYSWSVTSGQLPPGVTLTSTSGAFSGTPTSAGNYNFGVQMADANGRIASQAVAVLINAALAITTASLPGGTAGLAYTANLGASGGVAPYTWSVASGQLAAGLTLSSSGQMAGTPATAGSFPITFQVADSSGHIASQLFNLAIANPVTASGPLSIMNADLPNGTIGAAYTAALTASGGTPPYTWSLASGTLPAGITLNSTTGLMAGAPATVGWSNFFTVQVEDVTGASSSLPYSIIVNPVLDMYGGLLNKPCTPTGWFRTQKVATQWSLCSPAGNLFWLVGMGGVYPGGGQYPAIAAAKYGDLGPSWGPQENRRLQSWGFNTIGEVASASTLATSTDPAWPNGQQPVKMPFIATLWTYYSAYNLNGLAPGPAKDLTWGVGPAYTDWRAPTLDFFDRNVWNWLSAWLNTDASSKTQITSPWAVGVLGDDTDWLAGFGAGPDNPSLPDGYVDIHLGWRTLVTSPLQTFDLSPVNTNQPQLYSDTTVYAKAGKASPTPSVCNVSSPCTLRDYLWLKYGGNINALNAAWSSNYTTFDSTGVVVASESLGTGDGSTKVFTHTLAYSPIAPLSVKVGVAGTAVAGDCPWWNGPCNIQSANVGAIISPISGVIAGGVPTWLSGIYGKAASGYPVASYWAIIVYHFSAGSGLQGAASRLVGESFSTGNQQPFITSPLPDPQGLATGYDVYVSCRVWDGVPQGYGCAAAPAAQPFPTLQATNVPIGTDWGVPATGLIGSGSLPPGQPSFINYQNGQAQITFANPPASGTQLTISYIYNGWMSGGNGLMDEDGSHTAWVGTNPWCLTPGSFQCDGVSPHKPVANANPNLGTDLDAWISQFSAQFHKQYRTVLSQVNPSIMFLGADTEGTWGAPPRKEVLQGASSYVDALFPAWNPTQRNLDYIATYLGDKPFIAASFLAATPDSSVAGGAGGGVYDFASQGIRGQRYVSYMQSILASVSTVTNSNPIIGNVWWGLPDFVNEGTDWGLISLNDDPYDGKSACNVHRADPWGFQTGGESSTAQSGCYGDAVDYVKQANTLWRGR